MSEPMIVAVTPVLLEQLRESVEVLADVDSPSSVRQFNDLDHLRPLVEQIERLTVAVISAQTAGSLLDNPAGRARFDYAPDGQVAQTVSSTTAWLRGIAKHLEPGRNLPRHSMNLWREGQNVLRALVNAVHGSVRKIAHADLRALADLDPVPMADMIAKALVVSQASASQDEALREAGLRA